MLKIKELLRKNKSGFTLVELMAVVLIIGILVAIAIPMYQNSSTSAKVKTCKANFRTIYSAVEQYKSNNTTAASVSVATLVTDGYLKSAPSCPFGTAYTLTGFNLNETGGGGHFSGSFELDASTHQ